MKRITCTLTDSDIKVIAFALTILPSLGMGETEAQAAINYHCCCSAGEKLIRHDTNLTPNEFRVVYAALCAAQFISRGELDASQEIKKQCNDYLFSINKLVSAFEKQLS